MLVQLFIAAYMIRWFGALSNPLESINLCNAFYNKMNISDRRLNCHRNDNEWEFETKNIMVKITLKKMLEIHCRQPEAAMQNELNFFNFSNYEYHILVLTECTQLRDLKPDIDHLELSHIEMFNLRNFTKLQELELTNASQFQNLNSLSQLKKLTIQLMHLSNLTIKLDRLDTLTLKLNYLPDGLNGVQLINLKYLHLLSNRNLPFVDIDKFPNLIKLEIRSQFAANESYDVNRLKLNPKLENLEISYFQLSEIWNEQLFAGHQHLRTICLNNNGIADIRSKLIFTDLPNLLELDLSGNSLRNINFLVDTNLPLLRVLNLSKNKIKALDHGIHTLTALEQLHLNKNDLVRISDGFFTTQNKLLNAIYLQDNLLKFASNSKNNPFEMIASSLVTLNLKSNRLQNFNELYAFKFRRLKTIDVSHNYIKEIRGSELKFDHPINLNFESNNITEILFQPGTNYSQVKLAFGQNNHFNLSNCHNYEFIKHFNSNRELVKFPALDNVNLTNYYCYEDSDSRMCTSEQCVCTKFPFTKNYNIYCRNKNLTRLPEELPHFLEPTFSVNLDLDNNNFAAYSTFELPAVYYTKIKRLSLRNCSVHNFTSFQLLDNRITELYLDDNQIDGFSYGVIKNFTNLVNLTLADNRFECNCDTEYLYKYLKQKNFYNLDLLTCVNRNNTDFVLNEKFIVCQVINSALLSILIVTLLLVIILATITIIKLKFALELKLLIFVFKSRYFRSAATIKYRFDLFLSYSDEDTDFVEKNILTKLESGTKSPPRNHIVTINRDSTMDKMINEQIVHFVDNSKFIMIVLSKNFLNSDWNRFTFRTAYCNAFQNNRYPVIIVLKDNIKDLNSIDPTLRSYLMTRTYIQYNSPFFWSRINYILSK